MPLANSHQRPAHETLKSCGQPVILNLIFKIISEVLSQVLKVNNGRFLNKKNIRAKVRKRQFQYVLKISFRKHAQSIKSLL